MVRGGAAPPASPAMRARATVTAGETEVTNFIRMQQPVYQTCSTKVKVEIEAALIIYVIKLKLNLKCEMKLSTFKKVAYFGALHNIL